MSNTLIWLRFLAGTRIHDFNEIKDLTFKSDRLLGRQFGDHRLDPRHELIVPQWRPTNPLLRTAPQALRQVRAGDPDNFCDDRHREPFRSIAN